MTQMAAERSLQLDAARKSICVDPRHLRMTLHWSRKDLWVFMEEKAWTGHIEERPETQNFRWQS
jgi:hypothetical protein